jgi:hypothetical protein
MKTFNVAEDQEEVQDPQFAAIDAQRYGKENDWRLSIDQAETLENTKAWVQGLGMPGTFYATPRKTFVTVKVGPIDNSPGARARLKLHRGYKEMQKLDGPNPPVPTTHFKKCIVRQSKATLLVNLYY